MIEKINLEAFKTTDGEIFDNSGDAELHQLLIDSDEVINSYIDSIEKGRTKVMVRNHIIAYLTHANAHLVKCLSDESEEDKA